MSNNGTREDHGYDYVDDYFTLQLEKRAMRFLLEHGERKAAAEASGDERPPFFMMMGTPAAHANFIPPPQYFGGMNLTDRGVSMTAKAPRTPNWNTVCQHCHLPLRDYLPMTQEGQDESDDIWRRRLGTLAFVDDVVGTLWGQLAELDEDQNTFFLYTADNGFHLGQWGQGFDKRQLYETDLRVPYFVRCPGCSSGVVLDEPVSHIDIAPTVLDFIGAPIPEYFDGRSFAPLLRGGGDYETAAATWDPRVFVQYFGESYMGGEFDFDQDPEDKPALFHTIGCGNGIDNTVAAPGGPGAGSTLSNTAYLLAPCDGWNNTYTCTRKVATKASPGGYMFCTFKCYEAVTMREIPCAADQPEGFGEYYDMVKDPWQMHNTAPSLTAAEKTELNAHVESMRHCAGQGAPSEGGWVVDMVPRA